jgi:hypothetical protein
VTESCEMVVDGESFGNLDEAMKLYDGVLAEKVG